MNHPLSDPERATAASVVLLVKGLDRGGLERCALDLAVSDLTTSLVVLNGNRRELLDDHPHVAASTTLCRGTDRVGWRGLADARRAIRSADANVVHAHGPLPGVIATLWRRSDQRVVVTVHSLWPTMRRTSRALLHLVRGRIDSVTTVSERAKSSMPPTWRAVAHVVTHGAPAISGERQSSPTHDLISVANHRHAKDYPTLLRAMRRVVDRAPATTMLAVGKGPLLERHRQLAVDLGLGPCVTFVADDEAADYTSARLCVISSRHESQPIVALEAMAAGIPVVGCDVGRLGEFAAYGACRVVAVGDDEALARQIIDVLGDDALREQMARRARQLAALVPTTDTIVAYERLYRRTLGRPST